MNVNPADWMLEVSQQYSVKELEEDHGFFPGPPESDIPRALRPSIKDAPLKMAFSVRELSLANAEEEKERLFIGVEMWILLLRE
jgi:hypothetical protein